MNNFEQLKEYIQSNYTTDTYIFEINNKEISTVYVKDIDTLIDQIPPEQFDIDERLPYWADIWPSAIALGQYMEHINLEQKSVLELGSGVGLAGTICGSLGAKITYSDYEDEALKFSEYNAQLNNVKKYSIQNIDWRNPSLDETFDYIIGADIVYEKRQFTPVINMIKRFLNVGGKAYIAEPNRNIAFEFFKELENNQFKYRKFKQQITFNSKEQYISICEIYQ